MPNTPNERRAVLSGLPGMVLYSISDGTVSLEDRRQMGFIYPTPQSINRKWKRNVSAKQTSKNYKVMGALRHGT